MANKEYSQLVEENNFINKIENLKNFYKLKSMTDEEYDELMKNEL